MASATGIPQHLPIDPDRDDQGDLEPLLGRPGDASQRENAPIIKNFVIGTGVIAELAALILTAAVWAAVLLNPPLILFSVHPLAQSLGILVLIQSILVLQPTHTGAQKQVGAKIHAGLNLVGFALFAAGVASIEVNKFANNGLHFHSAHGYLGVAAAVWLLAQYLVGFTMFAVPALYGGETNARKVWKYHRSSGYALLLFLLATVVTATETDYNLNVLKLNLWATVILSLLIVAGVFPRIKKHKLGL
ncbi:eukaryotic cytochrome b561-domain-containing protein [Durotheca rogersii]|uniref:eukaryotic cytochrome b561-domain-containing protein n=1 Tax=Durotheca rogersii TaxID=419775 RepID=UPI0022203B34|nr:eukaryotic cytochrome b561-domain-containing protein [Durotheca rogersii]KAI5863381.1 eukaryotic cytochrome b561-domain-containing protein [Durotheca rogersii]